MIAAILLALNLQSTPTVPVRPPRIELTDLVRSWSWLDRAMSDRELDLSDRRAMSRRLDNIAMLFFQNDLGSVARSMDGVSLELVVQDEVTDAHQAAAALLIKVSEEDGELGLSSRWRYDPPDLDGPLSMTLVIESDARELAEVELSLSRQEQDWSIALDSSALNKLPETATMHFSLELQDGTIVPQGRWERTLQPYSESRRKNLLDSGAIPDGPAKETFLSRNNRLKDRIVGMDISGYVLDRNQLRSELALELETLRQGGDPYVNRGGDTWYTIETVGDSMPVRLYVPNDAMEHGSSMPLLIALHGAGGNEHFFLDGCGNGAIKKLADSHGMVVACPSTYVMASSMEPILDLVRILGDRYSIDHDRIYLLGHSLGGMAAMALAAGHPGLVDGVVAIAGGAPFPKEREFPRILAYAAERDFIVSGDMIESSARKAIQAGAPVTLRRPEGTGHLTIVMEVLPESIDWLMENSPGLKPGDP